MGTKYVTKEDLNYAAQIQKNRFVKKETGKGLSTNDLTNELKAQIEGAQPAEAGKGLSTNDLTNELKQSYDNAVTKVNELEAAGGQPNVIETVKVNGEAVSVTEKAVNITVPTETEIDNKIKTAVAGAYKVKGSTTFAALPTEGVEEGFIYNVTDAFTTTAGFAEGAGVSYLAGTNVVWTSEGKWDCMAGTYDFSGFVQKTDIEEITEEEIDAMYSESV